MNDAIRNPSEGFVRRLRTNGIAGDRDFPSRDARNRHPIRNSDAVSAENRRRVNACIGIRVYSVRIFEIKA